MSRVKLGCVWRFGLSGGARLGTAGGAASMEDCGNFETSTAVVGLSAVVSTCSVDVSVGRLSVDLNFDDSDLAEIDSFPLDLGGGRVWACDNGGCMLSNSSSSSGEGAKGVLMILPDDGNLGLCPNEAEPPPLGFVRCERKETDRLTLCPRSDTLEVRLNILLSLLCPLMNLLLSLSSGTSSGGLSLPFRLSSDKVACSFVLVCFFPVNRPNTLEEVVEKEGI